MTRDRHAKRLFGTDGIRGVAGHFPLDPATVERIGRALTRSLATAGGRRPRIVVGRDTRESGPEIERALVGGIEAAGGQADKGGVLTTPAVACVTRLLRYDAGVVVSASHNPYRDNGLKIFSGNGQKLPDALEAAIERCILDEEDPGEPLQGGADPREAATEPADLQASYLRWLRETLPPGASFSGLELVLDCANGAASSLGPEIFRRLGASVTTINAAPDGRNINEACGALHPEGLAAEVVRRRAHLGLAFDGDADRCLLIDARGSLLDGDYILYLAARDLKRAGRLPGDTVVGTVMSNLWLERALRAEGITLLRAPVGDKYVLEEMQRGEHTLGGEQSGHIIFLETSAAGDGLLTGLLTLDLLRRTGLDLAAWAASVRPCPQVLLNVPVRSRPPLDTHPRIGPAIRDEERRLGDRGRLLVRYSGTEPKARIMVEGESRALVEECASRLKRVIQTEIGQETI
ncbi:MAG TPA: phosphoglucosamine mutase [Candidatus Polarisedimenticolia bacterium]|nr:phosphoglucosamine mutase [Candidatus Polarisedimenticolia bacterium]